MEEIFRYQQLRLTQKLSEEEKQAVGLALYPDKELSELAKSLVSAESQSDYHSIIERFKKINQNENIVDDAEKIDPTIRPIYDWINFKARPIKKEDFKKFVGSLEQRQTVDINKEWSKYADNLILNIYDKRISINHCIDLQLLIKILYLIKLGLIYENGKFKLQEGLNDSFIESILELPILIPPKVFPSRCTDDCKKKTVTEFPDVTKIGYDDRNPCECKCNDTCQKPNFHCICIKPYIGDLYIIKEELARYEEGDIAHIENILAGEMKIRRHRNLYRTEDTREAETETITNEERDHQTSEKLSLQSEVKKTVDAKVGIDAGITATNKYGPSVTIAKHANVTASYSKSQADNHARSYAKEIIDRSVSKIQEKVRKLEISKIINELEERNKHSINNTDAGADHRSGIYYWVNKITHAQVFNYGKHLMFDVIIPEPAATFKKLYELKNKNDNENTRPEKPNITLESITRLDYANLLNKHGLSNAAEPPEEWKSIQFALHQNLTEPEDEITAGFSSAEFKSEPIPDGYKAENFDYSISCFVADPKNQTGSDEAAVSITVGKSTILAKSVKSQGLSGVTDWGTSGYGVDLNGEEGTITASVAGYSSVAVSVSGTISVKCKLTAEGWDKWRVKIFNEIMNEYNRKLAAFDANKKEDPLIQIKGRNPFLNREIERNEFKRHIIAILMCNYFNGIGSMMDRVGPCGYPEIDFLKLEKDAAIIQFFEQVFEWNYVTYLFYHSMWARKCKWPELIDADSGDSLFDKFLMAGASRVQVPVRPGMEEVFHWFLKTHQIWGASGIPPVPGDDEYVAMIQELKESKQCDYNDRDGLIEATNGSNVLKLTDSSFYWDIVNNQLHQLNIKNDTDRELLLNYKIYRIVKVEQPNAVDTTNWNITMDRPFEDATATNLKHAVGALFVGAPWEIRIPTKLVYLRNQADKLPTYPLS